MSPEYCYIDTEISNKLIFINVAKYLHVLVWGCYCPFCDSHVGFKAGSTRSVICNGDMTCETLHGKGVLFYVNTHKNIFLTVATNYKTGLHTKRNSSVELAVCSSTFNSSRRLLGSRDETMLQKGLFSAVFPTVRLIQHKMGVLSCFFFKYFGRFQKT
jgi:hypothetical protein